MRAALDRRSGRHRHCFAGRRSAGHRRPADKPERFENVATEDLLTLFPFFDLDRFLAHSKAAKPEDCRRILRSANSEDWVTWNVVEQLRIRTDWWPAVVGLAKKHASVLADSLALGDPPSVDLWRQVPSPGAYERASRKRMADSNDADWRNRATSGGPLRGRRKSTSSSREPSSWYSWKRNWAATFPCARPTTRRATRSNGTSIVSLRTPVTVMPCSGCSSRSDRRNSSMRRSSKPIVPISGGFNLGCLTGSETPGATCGEYSLGRMARTLAIAPGHPGTG